jgi:hypothetical protein
LVEQEEGCVIMGHVQASTTMRYAHLQDEALPNANHLATIIVFNRRKLRSHKGAKLQSPD